MAWAAAKPLDSKPRPLKYVFASTIFSNALVVTLFSTAALAFNASSNNVSRHNVAKAKAAFVTWPPGIVKASLFTHAAAS